MKKLLLSIGLVLIVGILHAQDYRFGKVSDQEVAQQEHPTDPSADAAILYREMKTEFQYTPDKGWFLVTEYFERIKIYKKDGAKYANKTIKLYKANSQNDDLRKLRAFTYNKDEKGKVNRVKLESNGIFKEDVNQYLDQTKITMPNVQEGSVIEIRYAIESPFVMNIDEFRFQELIPVDNLHMTFSAPEDFLFQSYQRGWLPIDIKTTTTDKTMTLMRTNYVDGEGAMSYTSKRVTTPQRVKIRNVIRTIDMTDIPAIQQEPYVGNIENYMSGIQFELSSADTGSGIKSFSVTWEDVSKSIFKSTSFGAELDRTNYYKKDLEKLLEGISNPDKKIEAIYDYVQQKMTWNHQGGVFTREGVRKAYKDNTGNAAEINLMLTSMLKHAGLTAYPVLISTRDNGIPLFPTINGFNYVVASVETPQGIILLDATNKNSDIGVLSSYAMNGNGRLLRKDDTSDWVSLTPIKPAVNQTLLSVKLNDNLEVEGSGQQRFTGNYALNYRNNFKEIANTEWAKKVEKMYENVEFVSVDLENLDNPKNPVMLKYDFTSTAGIEEVGGKIFMSPLFFMQTKENPFKSETRKYPIDFGYPYQSQIIVNFAIPEGYELESIPENAMSTLGNVGTYKYLISQRGGTIQLSVELSIHQPVIAETDYNDLKKFFELLIEKESEKIVFKKA